MTDICRRKHRGNPESNSAFRAVADRRTEVAVTVYCWILEQGSVGATCEEVSNALGMRYTTASARISELKRDGWLVQIVRAGESGAKWGVRRKTESGSFAAVLRAVKPEERAVNRQLELGVSQ